MIFLFAIWLLVPVVGWFLLAYSKNSPRTKKKQNVTISGIIVLLSFFFLLSFRFFPTFFSGLLRQGVHFNSQIAILAFLFSFLCFFLFSLVPLSFSYAKDTQNLWWFQIGFLLLIFTSNFLVFIVITFLFSLPNFVEFRNKGWKKEANLYLFFQGLSLCLFLVAVWPYTQHISLHLFQAQPILVKMDALSVPINPFSTYLLLFSLLIRLDIFPFHLPFTSLMEKGGYKNSLFHMMGQISFLSLLKFEHWLPSQSFFEPHILFQWLFLLSALYFGFLTFSQKKIKNIMHYQYLSMLSLGGLAILLTPTNNFSIFVIEVFSIAFAFAGLFCISWLVDERLKKSDILQFHGIGSKTPHIATFFLILLLASVGLPGTIGFVAEEQILQHGFHHSFVQGLFILTTLGINAWVLFKTFCYLFLGSIPGEVPANHDLNGMERFSLMSLVLVLFVLVFLPHSFF